MAVHSVPRIVFRQLVLASTFRNNFETSTSRRLSTQSLTKESSDSIATKEWTLELTINLR